jgi:hypothetical protein
MGQAPSIQDGTYTTKLPADVDEEQFSPSSTSLPLPLPRRAGGDPTEVGFAYFIQKCRFVKEHSFLFLVVNLFSALRSSSRASKGDVLVTAPMTLQSPRLSALNSLSLKSRLGCWSSPRRFALTSITQRLLQRSPSPRIFRPSVANSRSLQINSY